jgi:polysaccharide pyruvyl transferase WcaK-like protein
MTKAAFRESADVDVASIKNVSCVSSKDARSRRALSVLILGGDTDANLGDRAILQGTVIDMRRIAPDTSITVISAMPSRLRLDVQSIPPGPRGFIPLCMTAMRCDLVLCGGGGLFQDDDSLVKMPYWFFRILLMRALGSRVVGHSLGVGPLASRIGRLTARLTFSLMESISVRDPLALETTRSLTSRPVELVPDPALLLPSADTEHARKWLIERGVPLERHPIIGVALRRWFPPGRRLVPHRLRSRFAPGGAKLSEKSAHLATLIAAALDDVVRRNDAYVVMMPSYGAPHEGDVSMAQSVISRMSERRACLLELDDPALYKAAVSHLDLFLGGRMHPTIFAASQGVPIVGLAYNQKFNGFFQMLGLEDRIMSVTDLMHDNKVRSLADLISSALQQPGPSRQVLRSLSDLVRQHNRSLLGLT